MTSPGHSSRILIDGVEYPPLPESVASQIREIIEADFEKNPEAREIWIAEAERQQSDRSSLPLPSSGAPQEAPAEGSPSSEEEAA
ncbi:MAG TPA: hypothetical protein VFE20_04925 [Thermoleophilia bacterium]|nr:hypothetical protein [Thermoleophilia bacterium]